MNRATLYIFSEKFVNGGLIPAKYTCDAENINPPLDIENLPKETKSLVVMLEEISKEETHSLLWLQYNIPAKNWINEDEKKGEIGLNMFNESTYIGPCPKSGIHRYLFKVYALDDFLFFKDSKVSKRDVEGGIKYHNIGYGEMEAIYGRKVKLELARISQ